MKTIFITGGCGFIGSHIARELLLHNCHVVLYDAFLNYISPFVSNYEFMLRKRFQDIGDKVTIVRGDIRAQKHLHQTMRHYTPDAIIHLAAIPHAGKCQEFPEEATMINVDGTVNVLEGLREVRSVRRFLFVSSSFVYGHFQSLTADEEHPLNPIDVYGGTKVTGEVLTKSYCQELGVDYTIIRPSGVYGFGDVNRRVSQLLVQDALAGRPLTLHDGGMDRIDFTCIKDVARGFVLALFSDGARNEVFNLTRGEARSIREFADIVRTYVPNTEIQSQPADLLRPKRGALNIDKARRLLGYNPHYSLEQGIAEYIEDLKRHKTPL